MGSCCNSIMTEERNRVSNEQREFRNDQEGEIALVDASCSERTTHDAVADKKCGQYNAI